MASHRCVRTTLATLATSALLLAGTTLAAASAAATAGPVITPAQALTTLNAYFPVNNKANDTNDVSLYDTIEAGSVAYED